MVRAVKVSGLHAARGGNQVKVRNKHVQFVGLRKIQPVVLETRHQLHPGDGLQAPEQIGMQAHRATRRTLRTTTRCVKRLLAWRKIQQYSSQTAIGSGTSGSRLRASITWV